MYKNLSEGIALIEGIGPETVKLLESSNISTILDFIAEQPENTHKVIGQLASLKEVKDWHRMALFMQIDAINGQYAEALVKSGVKTISAIAFSKIETLQITFDGAVSERTIPTAPSQLELFEIIREASILAFSQTFLGKIVDKNNEPVAGATVKVYYQKAVTNQNGYFRLYGLMSPKDKLFITTEPDSNYCFENYSLSRYPDNIEIEQFILNANSKLDNITLSEFNGDTLPQRSTYATRIENHVSEDLRLGDIFLVRAVKSDKDEVHLQSIFTDFDGIKFVVHVFKVAITSIAIDLTERSYIQNSSLGIKHLKGDRSSVKYWKSIRKQQLNVSEDKPLKITLSL